MSSHIKSTGNLESVEIAATPAPVLNSATEETDGQTVDIR